MYIIHFLWDVPYKPSIWRYPHLWTPRYSHGIMEHDAFEIDVPRKDYHWWTGPRKSRQARPKVALKDWAGEQFTMERVPFQDARNSYHLLGSPISFVGKPHRSTDSTELSSSGVGSMAWRSRSKVWATGRTSWWQLSPATKSKHIHAQHIVAIPIQQ